jgi:Raf kinase inhibitor-like YbhB/YbcL family protein
MLRRVAITIAVVVALSACGEGDDEESPKATSSRTNGATTTEEASVAALTVESGAFGDGEAIPEQFTCEGDNVSPALSWSGSPDGTESLTLVMDDPDAPGGTFTHWLLYDLPPETLSLPEDVETGDRPGVGGVQGRNNGNRVGYTGPCPPEGQTHTYVFTVYALDAETGLEPGASADEVHAAIAGHVLAQGALTGAFGR